MSGFKDVVGHKNIIKYIQNAVTADAVSHAYILNGDRPSENIRAVHVFCQYVTILPMANIWNEFAVQKAFLRKKGQLIEAAFTSCVMR